MSIPTSISPKHWQEWQASSVSDEIIALNAWTLEDPREVDQLLNRNTERRWKHSTLAPGWAVAGCDPLTGERITAGCQFKPDNPPTNSDGKALKYFGASGAPAVPLFLNMPDAEYWSRIYDDVSVPIVLTEGAKKAGSILSRDVAGVSIPGVSTGGKLGRLKPQLKKLCTYGRKVYLAFDRDLVYKRQVQNALHNLARMIMERGAMIYVLEWHDDYKGIDDYFAGCSGGMPLNTMMERAATLEEWRDEQDKKSIDLIDEPCKLAKRYAQVSDRLGKRLRWNNLMDQMELDGKTFDPTQLRMFLALKHNMDIPLQDCQQICVFLSQQNKYSPVAEYLEDVAAEYGADDTLLDSVAETYLGAGDELHRTFLRKTLISAVARAMNPGCKVDTVCILVGDQGVGKSGFWEVLAGDWFDDSFGGGSDKDERLKLHRTWFVEWGELESIYKRRDVSSLKSFIACKKDSLRPPYGATTMDYLRPSIFVGTTNRDDFLADSTGNRRFWVVPVGIDAVPFGLLKENRDRIWAAAYHAFKAGEDWKLPKKLKQAAQATTQDYIFVDPWEQPVKDYIEGRAFVPTSDILSVALGLELSQQGKGEEMRLADILRSLGWIKKRPMINGQRIRGWIFKDVGKQVGQVGQSNNELYQDVDGVRVTAPAQPTAQPTAQPVKKEDLRLGSELPQTTAQLPCPTSAKNDPRLARAESIAGNELQGLLPNLPDQTSQIPKSASDAKRNGLSFSTEPSSFPDGSAAGSVPVEAIADKMAGREVCGRKIEGANGYILSGNDAALHCRVIRASDKLRHCYECDGPMVQYFAERERAGGDIRGAWFCAHQISRYEITFYTPQKESKPNAKKSSGDKSDG